MNLVSLSTDAIWEEKNGNGDRFIIDKVYMTTPNNEIVIQGFSTKYQKTVAFTLFFFTNLFEYIGE